MVFWECVWNDVWDLYAGYWYEGSVTNGLFYMASHLPRGKLL